MSAGKNAALAGATLAALGKNGSILLSAGENSSLDTKKLQSDKDMTADAANYLRTKRGTELAAEIRADGNISVTAGHDLNMRAAEVSSKNGTTSLSAGNDISLTAGREASEDHYGIRYKESGLLSSKTTTIRIDTESDTAHTTNITGQNVNIAAKRDAVFEAANIAADHDVNITAGRNVSVTSAENYSHTENYEEVRKSGIFGSGGLGFTIGTQQTKTTRDSDALTQQGTNISALGGSISISAGETAHISSGNILANKDATVTAKETHLDGKDSIYRESITQESRTTGLTVSLGHGLLDLGQSLYAPISRMGEVQDDRLKAAYAYQTGRMIHDAFKKNPLTGQTFSLDVSFGTSKSYSHMESTTHEYAGSRIASGGNTNVTAGEHDLTVKGSVVTGNNVSLTAKENVRLEAGENTSITTTENKFSSASIGASFTPQGLSNISVNASKGNGSSKETVTSYSPAIVVAENDLSLTSGKDMDIIGSKAQGDKITAKVGGNLNIETLQEKETFEEQNKSAGFGFSWGVKAKDKQTSTKSTGQTQNPPTTNAANSTPKPNGTQVTSPTGRKFFDPTIGGSRNKGTVDSHYRSARDQAGFFAGSKGFDIYARENTDLKGGIIASNAPSDKNHLSTGTFSFSDLKNEADYSAKSTGSAYHKYGNYDNMSEDEQNKVFNTIGLAPVLPMPVVGSADSTTKAAVAAGTIDIRDNPTQDISALSRDTANSLNELGKIFDKAKIEEQQELASVFGEEAFRLLHNMKDDGSGRKIAAHAIIGGLMSQITGAGFASGAIGAGLNEALINSLKGLDPGTAQVVSSIIGAAAAKVAGGNALAGASAAASGAKWNLLSKADYNEKERRFKEAPDWIEQDKILDEYWEKNLAQEKNEEAEREALEAKGWTTNEIDDYFDNVRYQNYVTFNGKPYYRLGETIIRPYPTRQFWDFAAGIAYSTDENMSFGVMRELYRGITGHSPYSANTNAYHLGRLTGDIGSMYRGLQEIAFGMGTMGGGIAAGATGAGAVTTPALTAAGAAAIAHGGTSIVRARQNLADDLSRFSAGTSGNTVPPNLDTVESAIKKLNVDAKDTTMSEHGVTNMEKRGDYQQALKEFNSLQLKNVREIDTTYGKGIMGELGDGKTVLIRKGSKTGGATLEIQISRRKSYKVRYL